MNGALKLSKCKQFKVYEAAHYSENSTEWWADVLWRSNLQKFNYPFYTKQIQKKQNALNFLLDVASVEAPSING